MLGSRPLVHTSPSVSMDNVAVKYSFPKSSIRVLLLENVHKSAVDFFNSETFQVECIPRALSEDELIEKIRDVHILGIRSKTRVTLPVIAAANRLLAIGCFCIGTDQVSLSDAEKHGIPVFNAPFSNTRSVAELVLGELVVLARRLSDKSRDMHRGTWSKSAAGCVELRGKTLGIVGYGHIGSQLSVLAEAFGLIVRYYDIRTVLPMGNGKPCKSMQELLAVSDFVTLHVPKAESTNGLMGKREFAQMRPGAFFVNASRGTVVDIDALADALRSGHLGGAAVDVFPSEPAKNGPGFESPLCGLENVVLTPHIGGSTAEAQKNIGLEVASALARYCNAGSTASAVNFPNLDVPHTPDAHRILNVHRNTPGVLSAINNIVSSTGSNIFCQVLGTSQSIGYIIMDMDTEASSETKEAIKKMPHSISTRILY